MAGHTWGAIAVLSLGVLVGATVSNAAVVFENPWNSAATDAGAFSDTDQILAGGFSLAGGASVDRATWYGTMFSSDPLDTGDTWNFDIVFWTASSGQPGTILSTSSVVASVTDTGININDQFFGSERAYLFDASFADVTLTGGTPYFLSVINTGAPMTFRWNAGLNGAYLAYVTYDAHWELIHSPRSPLSFALYDDGAAPAVPAPGAVVLVGLGASLATWLRRRRIL